MKGTCSVGSNYRSLFCCFVWFVVLFVHGEQSHRNERASMLDPRDCIQTGTRKKKNVLVVEKRSLGFSRVMVVQYERMKEARGAL